MTDSTTITVAGITFDNIDYDANADVLYLHIGEPSDAVSFDESPEGHHLRFDANARLVGITLVGVRQDLEAARKIVVTLPGPVEIDPGQLQLLTSAA